MKRSRQHLRSEQVKQEQLVQMKSRENELLESEAHSLHKDARILIKAISKPFALTKDEFERVKFMMHEEQAQDADTMAAPSASNLMSALLEDTVLFPVK